MASFEEPSKEERLQIAQHFLLSSPPGQFHEVLADVRKIVKGGILTESLETGIARVYNTKNGKVVTAPSGNKVVLNAASEVDSTHYVDATNGSIFAIDHLTMVRFSWAVYVVLPCACCKQEPFPGSLVINIMTPNLPSPLSLPSTPRQRQKTQFPQIKMAV
jgi:hypothetical protein